MILFLNMVTVDRSYVFTSFRTHLTRDLEKFWKKFQFQAIITILQRMVQECQWNFKYAW